MAKHARYTVNQSAVIRLAEIGVPIVEQAARIVMDEIVELIKTSSPSGAFRARPGGGIYQASAPGEPPAERTSTYVNSFEILPAITVGNRVFSGVANRTRTDDGQTFLWAVLEFGQKGQLDLLIAGAGLMAARPHIQPAIDRAIPRIRELLRELGRDPGSISVRRAAVAA